MKRDSLKFSYFRQSALNKILSSDVVNDADSEFESWHRAKNKIREVTQYTYNRPLHFIRNEKCFVYHGC